ncbi:hypothetical protein HMPREF1085_01440 [Enterocloster bolteae 90A9]|uniref:Uncharacterized protein n=2 Tax=Enterocloster bolteae TaxID=208479 RepID=R0C3Z1_9FIRM|nr:hypothetical protein HMPREF1089_02038 [Enterocloster bolteae 90B3]ENZ51247.1 hypothetical protein HMPREF1085_01440 [Enterocloster bolteae 90A9]
MEYSNRYKIPKKMAPHMSHRPLSQNAADVCRTAPAYGFPYMTRSTYP